MKLVFNDIYILNNELLFYTFIFIMLFIIVLTIIFVNKELKKWIYIIFNL